MQIIISGRNVDVTDAIREHIDERFERLSKFEPRASRIEVILAEEKTRSIAEAVMSVDGSGPVVAKAEASEIRTAVDRLYDRLSRRARKERERRRNHKAPPGSSLTATLDEPEE
ncbi:MAG: ribosome-associated translation inhibitor RaiA [marine benthic group bacterium]|jgi:putative sigma-54 modulation protein|nr:ribosome-associated translation inhibitor RaiA [Gemmatimonadota bacterium]MCL7963125.1 ribosome-associated translation inhibitor RaiA [Candidatus Carthagonibacter metallireducens]MCL7936693.1 ribosome-associated translation inhibitor RaiA [Gemmatimonadota bacterium]MCL7957019.1 ribosome-associated translation inhibitor RaiA [Gemmatimonadota bacterium]MCL7963862.1 ribosome-associated translation inhibitor RaiA [Gemmatimonadota bacterium]